MKQLVRCSSLMKLLPLIFLNGLLIVGCSDDDPDIEETIRISGQLNDAKTGSPVAGAIVKNCPGAFLHLMPPGWTLSTTIIRDTTDECGYFDFIMPRGEAYWVDIYPDSKVEDAIILFQSCTHNDALAIVDLADL
jgi:hypothetical protein